MYNNIVEMNRIEKIGWASIYACLLYFVLMIILIIALPIIFADQWAPRDPYVWWRSVNLEPLIYSSPLWYRVMMNMLYVGWILLLILSIFSVGYIFWNGYKKKQLIEILNMSDREIVEQLKSKNYGYYKFLREVSNDGQIVSKIRDSARDFLCTKASKDNNAC